MIPLTSLRKPERIPWITYAIIAVNFVVFFWELTLSESELTNKFFTLALIPCHVGAAPFPETGSHIIFSMFLHGGWLHILGNMLFLFIFGPNVEDYLGKIRYLLFYLVAGFGSALAHTLIYWGSCGEGLGSVPVIGASGAIYGVMGAFVLLYPGTRIRTLAFFWGIPVGTVSVRAFYMLFWFFFIDLINGLASLGVSNTGTGGVAVWGHVGGFVVGLLLAFTFMMFREPPKVDPFENLGEN